jgi:hypothetical protein
MNSFPIASYNPTKGIMRPRLSEDVVFDALKFLDGPELEKCELVARRFHKIIDRHEKSLPRSRK